MGTKGLRLLLLVVGSCAVLWSADSVPIRKVYLTGSKQNAVHSGRKMLSLWTCLEPVEAPEFADAVIDLEVGTTQPIHEVPKPEPTGFVTCQYGSRYASCSELGGPTIVTSCSGRGVTFQCSSYSYDGAAMAAAAQDLLAEGYHALERKLTTHAYVTDKENKTLLWDFDEGIPHQGVSAWRNLWWKQLNSYVGCGATELHYKKKMRAK